jgi:hypothetical protein
MEKHCPICDSVLIWSNFYECYMCPFPGCDYTERKES